jgi:hypothetical protein
MAHSENKRRTTTNVHRIVVLPEHKGLQQKCFINHSSVSINYATEHNADCFHKFRNKATHLSCWLEDCSGVLKILVKT